VRAKKVFKRACEIVVAFFVARKVSMVPAVSEIEFVV